MARAAGGSALSRIVQQDFSGGMFSSIAPEMIPANGAFDITNGLLNEQDVCYRRGGSSFVSAQPGGPVRMLWAGLLKHGGLQTLLASPTEVFRVEPGGSLSVIAGLKPPAALTVPTVFQGVLYYESQSFDGTTAAETAAPKYAATCANRVLRGEGARVAVGAIPTSEGGAFAFEAQNYFALPEGAQIVGMMGWRTSCVVFTTHGIWLLSGLAHKEIVDASGNVQWSQDQFSADAVLWGEPGVAAWKGGLVIPCRDDVWVMELGVSSERRTPFKRISGPIETLYRGYVAQGCEPGAAVVFNGHYFLPILHGGETVDLLVCRLEGVNAGGKPEPAWTHLAGYGAGLAALVSTATDLEGLLLGATATTGRVLSLGYFTPGPTVETDADGSAVSFSLTTRSIATGNMVANMVAKARLSYRLTAPAGTTMTLGVGATPYGTEWGTSTWGGGEWVSALGPFTDLGQAMPVAGPDPEALTPKVWRVRRKVRYVRMKIALKGPASEVSVRALELFVRQDGRLI